jgi:ribosomal protein S18 acetylase RimI-like enzyme
LSIKNKDLDFTFDLVDKKDYKITSNLVRKHTKGFEKLPEEALRPLLTREDLVSLIAKRNDTTVGFIIGTILLTPRIHFLSIIDQDSARKGLGAILIDEFIEEVRMRHKKAQEISVIINANITDGVALYSLKGFVVNGFIKGLRENTDTVHLKRTLPKKKKRYLSRFPKI